MSFRVSLGTPARNYNSASRDESSKCLSGAAFYSVAIDFGSHRFRIIEAIVSSRSKTIWIPTVACS
jgi:hypothetical protein